ncbi:MAG: hypothetical protein Q8874_02895, partial [Sweet potato little leaf phytoplasma]|nr:hypothetical protein [Sweet potato little leaf phytoplasma]
MANNQNTKLQTIIISENESGNANKAPKLLSLEDYPHWKDRFETYINGVNTNLWITIEKGYVRPIVEGTGDYVEVSAMKDKERKEYDTEKK